MESGRSTVFLSVDLGVTIVFFERKVLGLVAHMSMRSIGRELGESDATLWRIFKYYIGQGIKYQIDLKGVRKVCVDETAIKRGHNYMTIFTDYETGEVIYVTRGRKKEVFEEFYGWLWDHDGHPNKVELFSMDMSKSYIAGQKSYFAHSEVVFDRFHIKKGLNEAVDKVRKSEVSEFEILKKSKYIWLKSEKKLSSQEASKLDTMLNESNLKTAIAYKLKQEFDHVYKAPKQQIEQILKAWIDRVYKSQIPQMIHFANTLISNWKGILNAIKTGITNALAEGINSKIQAAKTKARGYPNFENFKNMVYFLGRTFKFKFHSF